jgi:transposase
MNEKNPAEIAYRRHAFKLFDKGKSTGQILQRIPRSRPWLFKWKRRFRERGWPALDSVSKAPKRSPHRYAPKVVEMVWRVRRRLQRDKVGLCGARAVFLELKRRRLCRPVPSLSTIKRWLREAGVRSDRHQTKQAAYYPAPQFPSDVLYVSMDWLARYLEGGEKLFCFHSLDHLTHALCQTIATCKSTDVACRHLAQSAIELGLIDFLQVDNDAAFTGLGRKKRVFGRFVRLALYWGIELIFIPPVEPKRNSLVERVNGLWISAFFDKDHFTSVSDLKRKRRKFLRWYAQYAPPSLDGLTVNEAGQQIRRRKLSLKEVERLPHVLPLTEGRLHFIRRVADTGRIEILKERVRVSKRLRGQYVWATLDLKRKTLRIYHRRSAKSHAKLITERPYTIEERIEKLKPVFQRRRKSIRVLQII